MDHKHTLDVPTHADNDASKPVSALYSQAFFDTEIVDNDVSKPVSKFTPPIHIEMGDEGSEFLESKVNEETNETVKADEDWTRLSGTRSINTSFVAGFMFQKDAGIGCSITMTENGNRPIRILIDEKQDFGMFLVVVLRHEKWTTSGKFHLRFVRRVPVSAEQCTARMDEPVAGTSAEHLATPSDSGTSGIEERESATANPKETEENVKRRIDNWIAGNSKVVPPEIVSHVAFKDGHIVPLPIQPENSEEGDTTDEEDHRAIGAAALRERSGGGGGIIPPNWFPSTE